MSETKGFISEGYGYVSEGFLDIEHGSGSGIIDGWTDR
jgi:hypothetical protein